MVVLLMPFVVLSCFVVLIAPRVVSRERSKSSLKTKIEYRSKTMVMLPTLKTERQHHSLQLQYVHHDVLFVGPSCFELVVQTQEFGPSLVSDVQHFSGCSLSYYCLQSIK